MLGDPIKVDPSTENGKKPVPKQISGGVLNGKATSLPKPPYPPAARAVRASGTVAVQVLVDEYGSVVSASAVSGHPLLRAAAVSAARGARFAPTMLSGQAVKVSGVITYNFVPPD
jgi:TonB family protein